MVDVFIRIFHSLVLVRVLILVLLMVSLAYIGYTEGLILNLDCFLTS